MTIRRAANSERTLLRELWEEFEQELGGPAYLQETWEEAWPDLSRTIRDGVALVAEEDGRAVGFIFCVLGDRGRKTAHITDFYVRPEARGRGVGRALLRALIDPARETGLDHVSLEVLLRNAEARRLYERLGFAAVDVFMVAPSRQRRAAGVLRLAACSDRRRGRRPAGRDAIPAATRALRAHGGDGGAKRVGDRRRRVVRPRPKCAAAPRR